MQKIIFKTFLLLSAVTFSSFIAASEPESDFEAFAADPKNYCFGQVKESNEEYKRRWDLIRATSTRSLIGELVTNPISPSIANVVMNSIANYGLRKFIIDPSKNSLNDGDLWLNPANAKHYGAIGVTFGWNSSADWEPKRITYFEGPVSHFPTYTAYVWGSCIPNAEVIRSLGYQFESGAFYPSKDTSPGSFTVYMFASQIPILHGSPAVQYNYYLPPGGPFHFWDPERGVMPRFVSYAGVDNPDPLKNVSNIAYHERSGDPIFREVEPEDFKGFAEGGYELHLYLKKRMMQASDEFVAGKPIEEIATQVKLDVAEFKKTLPPVPEGFLPPTKIFSKETFTPSDLGEADQRVSKNIKRNGGGTFDCFFYC